MKILKIIGVSFLYVIYFLMTLESRNRYMKGQEKGYHCHRIQTGIGYDTYHFDRTKKPVREYSTAREFFNNWGLFNSKG